MLNSVTTWFANPYRSENMDAFDWFLFIGLLLVIMIAWRIILRHIIEGID